jgi:hypothetical protein
MSRIRLAFAVCVLAATVSACQDGRSLTGLDGQSSPGGARYNGGWAGSGHSAEPADSTAGGIGMAGSGHYVEGDGGIGMGGSGGANSTSADTVSTTLHGIGMAGSGY